jgi:hypothetical protein
MEDMGAINGGEATGGAGEARLTGLAIPRGQRRTADQRSEERLENVRERGELDYRGGRIAVRVLNVSNHGTMIEAEIEPHIGERVRIGFEGCNPIDCDVRWVRGSRIGLEFLAETVIQAPAEVSELIIAERAAAAPAPTGGKRQRGARRSLLWAAALYWRGGAQEVRLRNISPEGAMLEAEDDLPDDTIVVLDLGEGGLVYGRVRWSQAGQIGVRFEKPYELRRLARAA